MVEGKRDKNRVHVGRCEQRGPLQNTEQHVSSPRLKESAITPIKFRTSSPAARLISQERFLLVAAAVGYAFGYLYLVYIGRELGPQDFGTFGSLFAVFYIACHMGQAVRQAIARRVSEVNARVGREAALSTYSRLAFKLGLLCTIPTAAAIAGSHHIGSFFHVSHTGPVILLGLSISIALILDVLLGLLQGMQRFMALGVSGFLVGQGSKLVIAALFLWAGWGLSGAVGVLLASTALAAVVGLALVRKDLRGALRTPSYSDSGVTAVLLPSTFLVLFLAIPTSADVMLVSHFFDSNDAGVYNAAATLGKVVIFLPMAVSFVLLPKAAESHALGLSSRKQLARSLVLAGALSGGAALICWALPDMVVGMFFGQAYVGAQQICGLYAAAMLLVSLNCVLMHYGLATHNLALMLWADTISIAQVVAIAMHHDSLLQTVMVLLIGNAVLFGSSLPLALVLEGKGVGKPREAEPSPAEATVAR